MNCAVHPKSFGGVDSRNFITYSGIARISLLYRLKIKDENKIFFVTTIGTQTEIVVLNLLHLGFTEMESELEQLTKFIVLTFVTAKWKAEWRLILWEVGTESANLERDYKENYYLYNFEWEMKNKHYTIIKSESYY